MLPRLYYISLTDQSQIKIIQLLDGLKSLITPIKGLKMYVSISGIVFLYRRISSHFCVLNQPQNIRLYGKIKRTETKLLITIPL